MVAVGKHDMIPQHTCPETSQTLVCKNHEQDREPRQQQYGHGKWRTERGNMCLLYDKMSARPPGSLE
jgi:hypothetical protein